MDAQTDAPRILVVIPTLGTRLETLGRTLESIKAQRGVAADVVVVAPIDRPEFKSLIGPTGARLVLHPGHISAAVNRGFLEATRQHVYMAWIGDDDLMRPDALLRSSALLDQQPSAVLAYGPCDYIDISGRLLFTRRPPPAAPWWLQLVPGLIKQETCLFRSDAIRMVGGLDESLRYAMDLDLLLRLRTIGSFARSKAVLAAFCWHAESITIANRAASFAEAQAVQRRAARGLVRLMNPLVQWVMRLLMLAVSARINKRHLGKA